MGLSASTWHYRRHPRAGVTAPVPQSQRAYPSRLSPAEQDQILAKLRKGFAAGDSVYQSWYDALDAGDPIASQASWYRLARTIEPERPYRPRRHRRSAAMPQFDATAPNQVWCWDITKLPGLYRGQWWSMYSIIDVFSRFLVGWRIEEAEDDDMAQDMFERAIADQGGHRPQIVHSDRGSSMTSNVMVDFYRDMGIIQSKNRPRVSNDNPYKESWYRTLKHKPGTPTLFRDLDQARAWATQRVEAYNTGHHHTSLEGHTPHAVHYNTWQATHHARQATLDQLAATHPERYHDQPRLKAPMANVRLNMKTPTQRLQPA